MLVLLNHQLSDAIAAAHVESLRLIGVEQGDHQLTAVAGVNGSGRINNGNTVLGGQTRARMHQTHVTLGQGDGHAGGHERALARLQLEFDARAQIGAGVTGLGVGGGGQLGIEQLNVNVDGVHRGRSFRDVCARLRAAGAEAYSTGRCRVALAPFRCLSGGGYPSLEY